MAKIDESEKQRRLQLTYDIIEDNKKIKKV